MNASEKRRPESLYSEAGAVVLERRWWSATFGYEIERHDQDDPDELAFYGSSVAEGICPDLHDEDDLVDDGGHDRRARRLTLGDDGWLHCEEGCAPWRFVTDA